MAATTQLQDALSAIDPRRNSRPEPRPVTREVSIAMVAAGQAFDLMAMRRQLDVRADEKLIKAIAHAEAALVAVQMVADSRRVRKVA